MPLSDREELELLELEDRESKQKEGVTTAEKIAGHPLTRIFTGAGAQGLGVIQAGSHIQDSLYGGLYDKLGISRPGKAIDENIAEGERMKEAGRKDRGSEGFDWYSMLGNLASPGVAKGAQVVNKGEGILSKMARAAPVGAAEAGSMPVTTEGDFEKKKAEQIGTGAVVSALIPPVGAALSTAGKAGARAADLVLPGGPGRITDRWLKDIVGEKGRPDVIQALEAAKNKVAGSEPTAADAVAHLPAGSPVIAAQKIAASKPGGPSADFFERTTDQREARTKVLEDLSTKGSVMQQRVGRALLEQLNPSAGKESPERLLKALTDNEILVKRATGIPRPLEDVFNKTQMKKINALADEAETLLQIKNPAQKTNLGGGMNIADETRTHLPQMLSRPMMMINAVLKMGAGRLEPKLQADAAEKFLNPQMLATALKDAPPGKAKQIIDALMNSGNVGAGASALAGAQEGR